MDKGQVPQKIFTHVLALRPALVGARLHLVLGMLMVIVGTILVIKASVLLGQVCAGLSSDTTLGRSMYVLMSFYLILEIGSVAAHYSGRLFLTIGAKTALLNLRRALFEKIERLPMAYFDVQPLGRIMTRLTNDVDGVEGFFGGGLARVATASVQVILVLVGIVTLSPRFGSMVVVSALPALLFSWFTRKRLSYWLTENKARNAHVNAKLAEFIQALPVLRVLGLEQWSADEFNRDARHHLSSSIKVLSWNSFIRPLTVFFSTWPTVVAVVGGGVLLLKGQMELAGLIAIIRLSERFSNPVRVVTQEIQVLQDAVASAVRVGEMLGEPDEVTLGTRDRHNGKVTGDLRFDHVSLRYTKSQAALHSLSLHIPSGQKVGVIGHSGAGKSSFLNLIPALYLPSEGRVFIDDVDIHDWDLQTLRSQIGYLSQEPFLFKGPISANILGVCGHNDPKIRAVFLSRLQALGLGRVLDRFSDGLESEVDEGGSNLSSGEKQMISFLRLLYEDRPILLMDEATSCLDHAWESLIQRAILGLMQGRRRTCIIIAHRLETLRSCDRIIRIHQGRIVADGPPTLILDDPRTSRQVVFDF
jgi:ATP-binding cassette subfamily B protein